MGAQLGSSVEFGSGCGQALPGVPRKAPLCQSPMHLTKKHTAAELPPPKYRRSIGPCGLWGLKVGSCRTACPCGSSPLSRLRAYVTPQGPHGYMRAGRGACSSVRTLAHSLIIHSLYLTHPLLIDTDIRSAQCGFRCVTPRSEPGHEAAGSGPPSRQPCVFTHCSPRGSTGAALLARMLVELA